MRMLTLLKVLVMISCQSPSSQNHTEQLDNLKVSESKQIGFVHAVYFLFKEDISKERIREFESSLVEMTKIKSISSVYYGQPAMTPRSVVDNTYDYAWITLFEDKTAHDAYQMDPIHDKFKKINTDIWEKVQIYDSLNAFNLPID